MKRSLCISTAMSLSLMILADPALAQEASAPPVQAGDAPATTTPPAQSEAQSTADPANPQEGLQEIVVTAQRRSENLQRAPIAITAVGGETLQSAGISQPTQLAAVVPALQSFTSSATSAYYLRGIGSFSGNTFNDSPVAFNFGGVYIARSSSLGAFFYDIERIEVLKGPQGTLYGRNATGGAINVIPVAPKLGDVTGNAVVDFGNYEAVRLDGALNLPVGDDVAIRVSGFRALRDGYMNDGTDAQDDYGGRAQMLFKPSETFSLNILAYYGHQGGVGTGYTPYELDSDLRIGITSPEGQAFYATQRSRLAGRNFGPISRDPLFLDIGHWGVSATADLETSIGTITVIPAYRRVSLNFNQATTGTYVGQTERDRQFSLEGRIASNNDMPFRYILGGFYFDGDEDGTISVNQLSAITDQPLSLHTKSAAAFGELSYVVTEGFKLTAGGRFTSDRKTYEGTIRTATRICTLANCPNYQFFEPGAQFPTQTFIPIAAAPNYESAVPQFNPATGTLTTGIRGTSSGRLKYENFSYKLGFDWEIGPSNLLYGSYSTGFKSGGFFLQSIDNTYRPETIRAWTIGSKNRFLDNRLQLNVEAFHWKYSNQQINHLSTDPLTNANTFITDNVGDSTFKGFEIETVALVTPTTRLTAIAQYLDGVYNDFTYLVPQLAPPPANGCPFAPEPGTAFLRVNCSGRQAINAPKWTILTGIEQRVPMPDGSEFLIGGRVRYQSGVPIGFEFTPLQYQDGYTQADAYARFTDADGKLYVEGYVNNLTDKTVRAATFIPAFGTFTVGSLKPPRVYGVRVGVNF